MSLDPRLHQKHPYHFGTRRGAAYWTVELDRRAWALDDPDPGKSVIFQAWIRHTRQHPERVFEP